MPRMPTYQEIRDDFDRGVRTVEQAIERPFRHHQTTAAQAAAAPIPSAQAIPTTQESHMSIGSDFHRVANVLETYGEEGIAVFEAIAGNPETRAGLVILARLAGIPLTPGTITAGMAGLSTIENIWQTAQQAAHSAPPQQPADAQPAASADPSSDPRSPQQ